MSDQQKQGNIDEVLTDARNIFLKGKKKEYARAKELLRRCAELDNVIAQYQLYAVEYNKIVKGDEKDFPLFWCTKAAEKNYAPAQYDLALHYLYGDGVEQDVVAAINWMEKAAKQNYKEAVRKLIFLYSTGTKIQRSDQKAEYWKAKYNGTAVEEIIDEPNDPEVISDSKIVDEEYILIEPKDLIIFGDLSNDEQRVTLINDPYNEVYQIMETESAKLIGKTSPEFLEMIIDAVERGEIDDVPTIISKIVLKVTEEGLMVIGKGLMQFIEN